MSEVRRCRRCKRKRMDDEPPEVRQYKTCAKCRIIERQKKKARKPLAEETMIYGMRQFQQQTTNSNFTNDDIFINDDLFSGSAGGGASTKKKYDNGSYAYQYQYQYQPVSTQSYNYTYEAAKQNNSAHMQNLNYQQIAQKALPIQSTSLPKAELPVNCDICGTKLDTNDDLAMSYKLCLQCYSNPFKLYNVFEDYNEFLLKIAQNKSSNIKNHIFIKEIDKNFIDNLNSINQIINNEKQFRSFVLDNLKKIYIEPIIASVGYVFTPISTNVNDVSSNAPTVNSLNQYQYKNTKPIKAYYKCTRETNNEFSCNSNLFLDYNLLNNILKIKFNHKLHNVFSNYPLKFINVLNELVQEKTRENPDEGGYNTFTAGLIYEHLVGHIESYSPEFQTVITGLNKEEFVAEFHQLEEVVQANKQKLNDKQLSEEPEAKEADAEAETPSTELTSAEADVKSQDSEATPMEDDGDDVQAEEKEPSILDPAFKQ